ncbi:MAG: DNA polymerase III subunit delta' [Paracoccaceae bacterium]|nr:DNA polymerase III subunit delta' [Paracoccaceae bacterium]
MDKILTTLESDTLEGTKNPSLAPKLIGHKKALKTFLNCKLKGKIHHAWIVSGPKGIGKATFSWKLSQMLLNQSTDLQDFASAKKIKPSLLSNIFLCRRPYDDKNKRLRKFITIDEIRKLKSFFQMTATDNQWRIAIIDSIDELNKSASNALLKILEEPPSQSIFFLVTNHEGRIPATIRSRCRILALNKLTNSEIEQILKISNYDINNLNEIDRHILSIIAEGSAGMAINTINNDGATIFKSCLDILIEFPNFNRTKILKLTEIMKGNTDKFKFMSSIILIVISRITLLTMKVKYITPLEQEKLLVNKIQNNYHVTQNLAKLHSELSKSFLSCQELNLDVSNQIIDAFIKIENKMVNKRYE